MPILAQAEQRKLHSDIFDINIDRVLVDVAYGITATLLEIAREFLRTCAPPLLAVRHIERISDDAASVLHR